MSHVPLTAEAAAATTMGGVSALVRLGELLSAEFCAAEECRHHPVSGGAATAPDELALLRSRYRLGGGLPPGGLLGRVGTSPRGDLLVSLLLPGAVERSGREAVTAELRRSLLRSGSPEVTASLLNLATEHELFPLSGDEVLDVLTSADERRSRHAALWHLARYGSDPWIDDRLLAWAGRRQDVRDLLLWTAVVRSRGVGEKDVRAALAPDVPSLVRDRPRPPMPEPGGVVVAQSALQGSLFHPGQGDSGGLSVFLTSLGSFLAQDTRIGAVVTITRADPGELRGGDAWLSEISPGHFVLRVPDFDRRPGEAASEGAGARPEIAWWATYLLHAHGLDPDILHVRFSDDATLAFASTARRPPVKLVYTVTPDPHRTVLDRHLGAGRGAIEERGLREDLHRMFVVDVLVEKADLLVGIPGRSDDTELARYLPQLRARATPVHLVPEGIAPLRASAEEEREYPRLVGGLFERRPGLPSLDPDHEWMNLILNVGRLHSVKQQDLLIGAWLASGLYRRTALVLIGGSTDDHTPMEREMLARVKGVLAAAPEARGRIAILPAMPNRRIRLLERAVSALLPSPRPHVYVCSSLKEEFGIAVLEAMDAGLLAMGPRLGGLPHYVDPGRNGFLVDTSSPETLAADLASIDTNYSDERLRSIARAGRTTVRHRLGIRRSSEGFARVYAGLACGGQPGVQTADSGRRITGARHGLSP